MSDGHFEQIFLYHRKKAQLEAPVQMNFSALAYTKEAWYIMALDLVKVLNVRIKCWDKNRIVGISILIFYMKV